MSKEEAKIANANRSHYRLIVRVMIVMVMAQFPRSAHAFLQRSGFEMSGLPILNATIDDVEAVGILDTGTSQTLIDTSVCQLLQASGVKSDGSIRVKLSGGSSRNAKVFPARLALSGAAKAVPVKCVELSVSGLHSVLGLNVNAVFGLDALQADTFVLRGATGMFQAVTDSAVWSEDRLPLRLDKNRIFCKGSLPILGECEFLLDTGAADSVSFPEHELEFLARIGHAKLVPNGTVPAAQADGTLRNTKQYILRQFEFHGRTLRDLRVTTSNQHLIGMHLLRYTDIFFDLQRAKLHLSWNGAVEEMCLKPGASGLRLRFEQDGRIVVEDSADESPAMTAGIRKGDQVLSIGGKPSKEWSNYMVKDRFSEGGSTVRLECSRDGKPFTVEFELKHRFAYPPEWPPEREEFNPD